jgi:hypothetical protein
MESVRANWLNAQDRIIRTVRNIGAIGIKFPVVIFRALFFDANDIPNGVFLNYRGSERFNDLPEDVI